MSINAPQPSNLSIQSPSHPVSTKRLSVKSPALSPSEIELIRKKGMLALEEEGKAQHEEFSDETNPTSDLAQGTVSELIQLAQAQGSTVTDAAPPAAGSMGSQGRSVGKAVDDVISLTDVLLVAGAIGAGVALTGKAKDKTPPTLAITVGSSDVELSGSTTVTFTFDEAVKDFTNADVNVTGGTLSTLAANADRKVFTSTFTPSQVGNFSITVADKAYVDDAGNAGSGASRAIGVYESLGGVVQDGLIAGAKIYLDADNDGVADESEYVATTDALGRFNVDGFLSGNVIAVGGTNIDTGLPNPLPLKAIRGVEVINPISTLVSEIAETLLADGLSIEAAKSAASTQVILALGLDPSIDLDTFDPISEAAAGNEVALAYQKAATKVATLVLAASESADAVFVAIAEALASSDAVLNLSDVSVLANIFSSVEGLDSEALAETVSTSISAVESSESLLDLAAAQLDASIKNLSLSIALTTDSGTAGDGISNIGSIRVSNLPTGVSVEFSSDGGQSWSSSFSAVEGQNVVLARLKGSEVGGETPYSTAFGSFTFILDTTGAEGSLSVGGASAEVRLRAGSETPISLIFSEAVAGLTEEDFSASGGSVLSVTAGPDLKSYVVLFKPAEGVDGSVSLNLAAGSYTDLSGNLGAAVSFSGSAFVNTLPKASVESGSFSVDEDGSVSGSLVGSDADGDSLTFAVASQGTKGVVSIDASTGSFTYAPNKDQNGTDSFSLKVNDGKSDSDAVTVSVTIAAVNDAPVVSDVSLGTDEDVVVTGSLSATDIDGDALVYSLDGATTNGGTVELTNSSTGAFKYTPAKNFYGTDTFTFKVTDGKAESSQGTVTIEVAQDMPPTVVISSSQTLIGVGGRDGLSETSVISFDFSEAVEGFDLSDVSVTGGGLSALAQSSTDSTIYTATFTPSVSRLTTAALGVTAGSYTDTSGNDGTAGTFNGSLKIVPADSTGGVKAALSDVTNNSAVLTLSLAVGVEELALNFKVITSDGATLSIPTDFKLIDFTLATESVESSSIISFAVADFDSLAKDTGFIKVNLSFSESIDVIEVGITDVNLNDDDQIPTFIYLVP